MTDKEKQDMWDIDMKAQLGDEVTKEDKEFFNANFDKMLEELQNEYEHFKHHANKFNYL
tara:strand:+ start:321 stop:497 length:177 start_codon:yes stop_codon:yes gene_type:complete